MNSPWKLILLLVGIFLAGIITGAVIDRRVVLGPKPSKEHRSTVAVEQWAPKHLKRLEDGLDLDAAQAEAVRPIIRRNMEELDRLRTYSRSETSSIFERMDREIGDKLTPEQRAKFEQMNKENRERMKRNEPREVQSNGVPRPPPKEGELPPPPPEKSGEPKK